MKKFQLDQLSMIVDTGDYVLAKEAVLQLFDFTGLDRDLAKKASLIFDDVRDLYEGKYEGYRACDTEYHNFRHIMDVLLASLRLTDAVILSDNYLSHEGIFIITVAALMHDAGYIPETSDPVENGAIYTNIHVERSIEFMKKYMRSKGYPALIADKIGQVILSTELKVDLDKVPFISPEVRKLAKILGAGDLLGQMADRVYLEKLLFLYREFKAGGVPGFDSEEDLLEKTIDFYKQMERRFKNDLEGIDQLAILHFKERYGIESNLYHNGMNNNISYLHFILENHKGEHRNYLRRDGLVSKL
ncbi:MAG TPA: HD domain-containing protein [bacterium]|nr:HD domain-containing protein [bacterium]